MRGLCPRPPQGALPLDPFCYYYYIATNKIIFPAMWRLARHDAFTYSPREKVKPCASPQPPRHSSSPPAVFLFIDPLSFKLLLFTLIWYIILFVMAGPISKKKYGLIPIGFLVRRSIAKLQIYRVRRGNGYYGSTLGELYQDKYDYFVPTSITNTESDPVRSAFADAVSNWINVLTPEEKADFNLRASRLNTLSGYNLYISEYVKAQT